MLRTRLIVTLIPMLVMAALAQAQFELLSFTAEPSVVSTDLAEATVSLRLVYDSRGQNLTQCTASFTFTPGLHCVMSHSHSVVLLVAINLSLLQSCRHHYVAQEAPTRTSL